MSFENEKTLTALEIAENKKKFLAVLSEVKRDGMEKLIDYIEKSDFFEAPASTRYHEAYNGGLCEHSLMVYEKAKKLNEAMEYGIKEDSLILATLLHDLCKMNFYKSEMRNKKDETGKWIQVPYFTVEDKFPFGHGEKSVFIIERFVRLSIEEAMMIRWHMGGFDDSIKGGAFYCGQAYEMYPAAAVVHISDMMATYLK